MEERAELLSSKEYWVTGIQLDLFNKIENYIKENRLNRTELAKKMNVTKGYITQVLNGDFDHKVSKLVELALACDTIPLLFFVDKAKYIENDAEDKFYELMPVIRPRNISFEQNKTTIHKTSYVTKNENDYWKKLDNKEALNTSELLKRHITEKNTAVEPNKTNSQTAMAA